jgi:hypothetical protein
VVTERRTDSGTTSTSPNVGWRVVASVYSCIELTVGQGVERCAQRKGTDVVQPVSQSGFSKLYKRQIQETH